MPAVIPVKFQFATRDLWFDPAQSGAAEGDHVICKTERGTEIGLATGDAAEISAEELAARGASQLKPVLRVASEDDLAHAEELADKGELALPVFRRHIEAAGLDMKPVGVEYLFGGEKVVCYFAAEERQDFRQLVRDLARELHERIDMRQIGVREEAAVVGGYAHCGQELCCARFGNQFEPVSIRMAKEQDLPLNSSKISGACGRLMCCLRYEFEAYRDFKGRAPKKNAVIQTPLGKAKIIEYDTPKEQLALRLESGKTMRIALADMTASEAACKKAEDLGCACRPDTVTREVLDRLDSADIRMALANLDREMGVAPADTSASDDLFVEPARKKRSRRAQGEGAGGDGSGAGAGQGAGQGQGQGASRKRRRSRGAQKAAQGSGAGAQGNGAQQRSGDGGQGQGSGQQGQPNRRRRHHRAEGAQGQDAGREQGRQATGQSQQGQVARTHSRKPGDRGGAQQAQSIPAGEGSANSGNANSGNGSGNRRRRHRRRGNGASGNGGGAE